MFLHKKCASHFYRKTIVWISHYFLTRIGLSKWRVNWNYDLQVAMPSRGLHVIGTFAHLCPKFKYTFQYKIFCPDIIFLMFCKTINYGLLFQKVKIIISQIYHFLKIKCTLRVRRRNPKYPLDFYAMETNFFEINF